MYLSSIISQDFVHLEVSFDNVTWGAPGDMLIVYADKLPSFRGYVSKLIGEDSCSMNISYENRSKLSKWMNMRFTKKPYHTSTLLIGDVEYVYNILREIDDMMVVLYGKG